MKSFLHTAGAAAALLVASTGRALADFHIPEPSSIGLAALGLGVAIFVLRKGKK
jgi:hypothetical protein